VLVGAVVIHHPHFLVPVRELMKAICVEPTPGKRESLEMISSANWWRICVLARRWEPTIDLADDGLVEVLRTRTSMRGCDFGSGFIEIAEGDEVRVERRINPGGFLELLRLGGNLVG